MKNLLNLLVILLWLQWLAHCTVGHMGYRISTWSVPGQSDLESPTNSNLFKWFIQMVCWTIYFQIHLVPFFNVCLQWWSHYKREYNKWKKIIALKTKRNIWIKVTLHILVTNDKGTLSIALILCPIHFGESKGRVPKLKESKSMVFDHQAEHFALSMFS